MLDGVEIGAVGRQKDDPCTGPADRLTHSLAFVAAEVVVTPLPITRLVNKSNFLTMILEEIPMKTSRFSDAQIMAILKRGEDGMPVAQLCREHGMSDASYCIYGLFPRCKPDFETV